MAHMSVTLDVSNVSGWLNADASCQGEGIYDAGRREGGDCDQRPEYIGVLEVHHEHVASVCDAGSVETQRLVELARPLPSPRERVYVQSRCVGEGRQARGSVRARKMHHRVVLGTGGERTENIFCVVVTLDVSKASGWLNAVAHCRTKSREFMRNVVHFSESHHRYIMPPSHIRGSRPWRRKMQGGWQLWVRADYA